MFGSLFEIELTFFFEAENQDKDKAKDLFENPKYATLDGELIITETSIFTNHILFESGAGR